MRFTEEQEQMLEIAEKIIAYCEKTTFCEGCPFRMAEIDCALKTQTPEHWKARIEKLRKEKENGRD